MALVAVEGGGGGKNVSKGGGFKPGLSGSVGPVDTTTGVSSAGTPTAKFQDPAMPAYDEGFAYGEFSPAATGGATPSTVGVKGGTVNYTVKDGDYYYVERPDGSYYWQTASGHVWEPTPVNKGVDAALNFVNPKEATGPTVPVVKQATLPDKFSSIYSPVIPATNENMAAFDQAYANVAGQPARWTDADMAALDLGFSNAMESSQRTGLATPIAEGAIPTPSFAQPSNLALPAPVMQADKPINIYTAASMPDRLAPGSIVGVREGAPGSEVTTYYDVGADGMTLTLIPGQVENMGLGAMALNTLGAGGALFGTSLLTPLAALDPRVGSLQEASELPFIRDTLGDFAADTVASSTSVAGLSTAALPVAHITGTPGLLAANAAQALIFGGVETAANKAGLPEPYSFALGLVAAVGSEAALAKLAPATAKGAAPAIRSATDAVLDDHGIRPAARNAVPSGGSTPLTPRARAERAAGIPATAGDIQPVRATPNGPISFEKRTPIVPAGQTSNAYVPPVMRRPATPEEVDEFVAANPAKAMDIAVANRPVVQAIEAAHTAPFVNEIGWTEIGPKQLSKQSKLRNLALSTLGKPTGRQSAMNSAYIDPIRSAIRADLPKIEGEAKVIAEELFVRIKREFGIGDNDLLAGFGVTLQDMAAQLPKYWDQLTPSQKALMQDLASWSKRNADRLTASGREFGTRKDIQDGGFYLPRGNAREPGWEDLPMHATRGGRLATGSNMTRHAGWDSMAAAMARGESYTPLKEMLYTYSHATGEAVMGARVAAYLKNMVDEFGQPITRTAAVDPNHPVVSKYRELRDEVMALRGQLRTANIRAGIAGRQEDEVDRLLGRMERASPELGASNAVSGVNAVARTAREKAASAASTAEREAADKARRVQTAAGPVRIEMPPTAAALRRSELAGAKRNAYRRIGDAFDELVPDDFSRLRQLDNVIGGAAKRAEALMERGGEYAAEARRIMAAIDSAKQEMRALKGDYTVAMDNAKVAPRGYGSIPALAPMNGTFMPAALAREMESVIQDMRGQPDGTMAWLNEFNALLRFFAATGDLSWTLIQGLMLAPRDPIGYGRAVKASVMALGSEDVLGAAIKDFNTRARAMEKPTRLLGEPVTAEFLAGRGLRFFGSGGHEFVPQGLFGKIQDLPAYKQSNRAFAAAADIARLEVTMAHVRSRLNKLPDTATRAEAQALVDDIIKGVNPVSGAASWEFGGNIGKLLFFAPRWIASQIETVAQGIRGTAGYAVKFGTGGQVQINSAAQDIAAQHLTALIAFGTATTVAVNEMLGNETDFRPYIRRSDGEWQFNSNFMRIRAGGKDWSIFGPWDSLMRAGSTIGLGIAYRDAGMITSPFRSKASPFVSILWSLGTGKDFLGENARSWDWAAEQLLPFSWRNGDFGELASEIFVEKDPRGAMGAAAKVGLGIVGMKSNPLTQWEAFDEALANEPSLRNFLYPGETEISWRNLTPEGRDQAREMGLAPPSETISPTEYQARKAEIESQLGTDLDYAESEYKRTGNMDLFKEMVSRAYDAHETRMIDLSEAVNEANEERKLSDDPFRRAEQQYYELYRKARLPNQEIDRDLFNQLFAELEASWSPAQRKFYREQIEPSLGTDRKLPKEVQAFKDAEREFYDSGFHDAPNKTQWLRENPEMAATIEQYKLSPYQTEKRKEEDRAIAAQAAIDKEFLENPMAEGAGARWRERTNANLRSLTDWKRGAGSQLPDYEEDSRDPAIAKYFEFVDAHTDVTGEVDYAAVDTYVAQNPGLEEKLDGYFSNSTEISPLIAQKREEQKQVEDSGLFSLRTMAWQGFAGDNGVAGNEAKDYYAWKNAHYSTATGWDSPENEKLATAFGKELNAYQVAWITANPDAAQLAMKWGYYTPSSNAEKEAMGIPVPKSTSSGSSSSGSKTPATPKTMTAEERAKYR